MPQVGSFSNTAAGDVLPLRVVPDTFVTSFMLRRIREAVARHLPDWFRVMLVEEMEDGARGDFVSLEPRVFGNSRTYQIWRAPGGFAVTSFIEGKGLGAADWPEATHREHGRFAAVQDAVEAIGRDVRSDIYQD